MAKLRIAPTKSNLMQMKDQLGIAREGHSLLEQKRDILVMELMRMVEQVKLLERDIEKRIATAYPSLRQMILALGRDTARRIGEEVSFDFRVTERTSRIAGLNLPSLETESPRLEPKYSFMSTFAGTDRTMVEFFELLRLVAQMAGIRTVVWRLAREVRKTQRRVNALNKMVIPDTAETVDYIESVLEEQERELFFAQKMLKNREQGEEV